MNKLKPSLLALSFLILAACGTDKGIDPSLRYNNDERAAHTLARVVIYYPSSFFWGSRPAGIAIGKNTTHCDLVPGMFSAVDITPGPKVLIAATPCGVPGTTQLYIKAKAGMTYYLRILPNDDTLAGRLGRARLASPKEDLKYAGPFRIEIMAPPEAQKELRKLKRCLKCSNGEAAY